MHLEGVSIRLGSNPLRFSQLLLRRLAPLCGVAAVAAVSMGALSFSLVGCGMEAAPQPPSLNLPKTIPNLTANRTGNQVHLDWTTPHETTDRLRLKDMVALRICRSEQAASPCETIATLSEVPAKPANYTDVLPPALTTGPARPITYRIFGLNKRGKTAGPSNVVDILAGAAPPEVRDLSAKVVERGVVLHWQPAANLPPGTSIQIERTELRPAAPPHTDRHPSFNPLPRAKEPVDQKFRIRLLPPDAQHTAATDPGGAIDTTAQFGREYTYRANRVIEQKAGQQTLQLESSESSAVEVATRDTFPPAPPSGLVAVPVAAVMNHGTPEVDLSWSANTESDFAEYRVYRRDVTTNQPMHRIAPEEGSGAAAEPVVAPAFRDIHVQAGQTYTYTVTAVDASGNESRRSAAVTVTVPTS